MHPAKRDLPNTSLLSTNDEEAELLRRVARTDRRVFELVRPNLLRGMYANAQCLPGLEKTIVATILIQGAVHRVASIDAEGVKDEP